MKEKLPKEQDNIHILLVEDNEGDILLTTEALREGKIRKHITVMRDGWEAIQFMLKRGEYKQADTPDLVLLDLNLPKKNGHEVLEAIRSNPETSGIPVIMLTTSVPDERQVIDNNANKYFTKPVVASDFAHIVEAIEVFLQRREN